MDGIFVQIRGILFLSNIFNNLNGNFEQLSLVNIENSENPDILQSLKKFNRINIYSFYLINNVFQLIDNFKTSDYNSLIRIPLFENISNYKLQDF